MSSNPNQEQNLLRQQQRMVEVPRRSAPERYDNSRQNILLDSSHQQYRDRQGSVDSHIYPSSSASQIPPYGQPYPQYQSNDPNSMSTPGMHSQSQMLGPNYNGGAHISDPRYRPQASYDDFQASQHTINIPPPTSSIGFVRRKTVRQIPLTPQGNLVIDVPVANRVSTMGRYSVGDEFTHMRYTAVTCPPDEFASSGYSLRQQELQRSTELFIVVTMYNEDDHLFCKSMQALMKNIAYLCSRTKSKTWGEEGWKKAIICIVSDGRAKVNPRVLDVLGIMGVYQDGIMKDHVNGKKVTGHLFEYTTQVCVTPDLKVQGHEKGYVPVQILFCLKEKNAKKINSHRWFFNSFGPLIRPEICVLIDVGTKPTNTSLYHLWKSFERNPAIGGACGEIYAELGTGWSNLLNPLVAAQNFEYKMSNILDKPLESICGYISVLPGAFSAYRYVALLGVPLTQYFKGETLHGSEDIFAANMYLAEDRILCFEIVTKKGEAWLLKYVKSARAETDVPDSTPEFISQRRRWLNGSFFASVHALTHWFYIFRSGHNLARKVLLVLEFVYNFINLFFSWFNIGFFYLTFFFLLRGIADPLSPESDPFKFNGNRYGPIIFPLSQGFYIMSVIIVFICSLGNRPQGSKVLYNMTITFFAIIMLLMLFVGGYSIYETINDLNLKKYSSFLNIVQNNASFRDVVISTASTFGLYLVSSILHCDPWHVITSMLQYLLLLPSFCNVLNVYAFANLHDLSWGTKGDNDTKADIGGVTVKTGKDGQDIVEVEMITELKDINQNYEKFIRNLAEPRANSKQKRDQKTKTEDYFRNFRTRVVLAWMGCNALVVVALSNLTVLADIQRPFLLNPNAIADGIPKGNPFLQFIFWSVFGLSLVRFTGSTTYLIMRFFRG